MVSPRSFGAMGTSPGFKRSPSAPATIPRADRSATWCAPALSRRKPKPTPCEASSRRDGYTGLRVAYTGEDGGETTGPWVVHVLEINPARYDGTLRPELATEIIPDKETLTSISARTDALAATNGGYFVVDPTDGTPGDQAGISVLRGQLASEAVDGRTSLLHPAGSGEGADIATLTDTLSATESDGARREVDGVNRTPGLIRAYGGVGGDQPTERPKHTTLLARTKAS
jgi:hypothetical protein